VDLDQAPSYELSVLVRKLAGPFVFAYVPHGPETEYRIKTSQDHLQQLAGSLKAWLPRSCLFIRFDPGWYCVGGETGNPGRPEFTSPMKKASDVQPPDTVVLDLSCSEEELLAKMKPKWRYNIKLAEKKNVSITEESAAALDVFYTLYQQTAARDRIAVHPKSYYEKLFGHASRYHADSVQSNRVPVGTTEPKMPGVEKEPLPDLRLWVARHEGQALACIVTLFYGTSATYLYGASSDEKRNLMPAYALQWAAIKAARNTGCLEYDMYGIPPTNDEHHPMAGLYRFKTGFGGELRHYSGAWDYVFMPLLHSTFHAVEVARLFWHKKIMKTRR
jgi:lipid II:glycine glycyltransferase (peptidoglycan interpeptide bridge formation enzyme)